MKYLVLGLIAALFFSCKESSQEHYTNLLKKWMHREIRFPDNPVFTIQGNDTVSFSRDGNYKILTYVDSVGCTSCKLQLGSWQQFMGEEDVSDVCFLFFFSPEKKVDIIRTLKSHAFTHPICIDEIHQLDYLNHFPAGPTFQTFLLDKDNRVLAVGNPIHNPKVKELYLKIIRGENVSQEEETPRTQTTVEVDRTEADMGRFDWREKQTAEFVLKNTGDNLLVVFDVRTSCGCTRVEYDGKPARPGEGVVLRVTYKADNPGHFRKEVTVRSNAEQELLKLMVTGEAEERK